MNKDDAGAAFIALVMVILAAIVGAAIGEACGKTTMQKQFQQEAIKHNAAHWEVTPDGTTVFVWNKEEE